MKWFPLYANTFQTSLCLLSLARLACYQVNENKKSSRSRHPHPHLPPELPDTALNVLWHDQKSLFPLIRVMSPDSFTIVADDVMEGREIIVRSCSRCGKLRISHFFLDDR